MQQPANKELETVKLLFILLGFVPTLLLCIVGSSRTLAADPEGSFFWNSGYARMLRFNGFGNYFISAKIAAFLSSLVLPLGT